MTPGLTPRQKEARQVAFMEDTPVPMRRAAIVRQDLAFQNAIRIELSRMAAERGLRLIVPAQRVRDVITIEQTAPSDVPMTDAQRIMKEVCAKHRVTKAELIGKQRSEPIVRARDEAAYRLKRETTMSLPQVGRRLGGRDHSSIIVAVKRHEAGLMGMKYRKGVGVVAS